MQATFPCHFEHWQWQVDERYLLRTSNYFKSAEGLAEATTALYEEATRAYVADHSIPLLALYAGNEAYAESAVADPLADLNVWHEWRERRQFPYPGEYEPFGIVYDDNSRKDSASSAVGALGEAIAGIYAQAGIASAPLVRSIGRWPDMILFHNRFHFLEVKASRNLSERPRQSEELQVIPPKLRECLEPALEDLALQPHVHMWLALVDIYLPDLDQFRLEFRVTFIELFTAKSLSAGLPPMPLAVKDGILWRAAVKAMQQVSPYVAWKAMKSKNLRRPRTNVESAPVETLEMSSIFEQKIKRDWTQEIQAGQRQLHKIAFTQELNESYLGELMRELPAYLERLVPVRPENPRGYRRLKPNDLDPIRPLGWGYLAHLTPEVADPKEANWRTEAGAWDRVEKTIQRGSDQLYRAGGQFFTIVPMSDSRARQWLSGAI